LNIKDLSEEERNKKMKELKLRYNQKWKFICFKYLLNNK
jgi:hypothetical protein